VRLSHAYALFVSAASVLSVLAVAELPGQNQAIPRQPDEAPYSSISVDYPPQDAVIPPELPPVAIRWRDSSTSATVWQITIAFADRTPPIQARTQGDRLRVGEIDPRCVSEFNSPPVLTPEEAAGHTWTPQPEIWAAIRKHSVQPATIAIAGFAGGGAAQPVSAGSSTFQISADPVGAPIFYRDVPLIPSQAKGEVGILPKDAIGYIKWRFRSIAETQSHTVLEGLPTCANCHSFSADGKTLGIDVDGPMNDKSLYAVVPLRKRTVIRTADVFKWNTTRDAPGGRKLRAGFMSQVSPDGRYVLTTLDERDPMALTRAYGLEEKFYFAVYRDFRFGQVFFPTRGALVWRDVATGRTEPLPGADDPRFAQTDGVWSPDGKWIVFARADARTAFPPGAPPALFANDPNETQIRYSLYRIPFNEGRGGQAEPVEGASGNGFSNSFPKITPDGRWIVYVRCRNGQLMRPDSQLYIVPFQGGQSRLMNCNTRLMNSWHSFSPNGRWMVFSSKARSPYTQLYLTHLDPDGNSSPPVLIENSTAANRAANIPEFVNIPPDGLEKLEIPASEFYGVFDVAFGMMAKGQVAESIPQWRKAVELDPEDELARVNLGIALDHEGLVDEAIAHYRKAIDIAPEHVSAYDNLAADLVQKGELDAAIEAYLASLRIKPDSAPTQTNLGTALLEKGRIDEAIEHCQKALAIASANPDAHNTLGIALSRRGQLDQAIPHLQAAVASNADSLQYQGNLARVLAQAGRFEEAVPHMERAVALSSRREPLLLSLLSAMYAELGRLADAIDTARQALNLASRSGDSQLAAGLTARIARYQERLSSAPR